MSTLPFLLSVADELDNIHTQSYMDDFGLGFHPHRQYYRTPTIQLSLPASTDWTGRADWTGRTDWQGRHARYRSYKFYDDTQNNLEEESQEPEETEQQREPGQEHEPCSLQQHNKDQQKQQKQLKKNTQQKAHTANMAMVKSNSHDVGVGGMGLNLKSSEEEDDENIDRTVRMYNLSKKCCKNYYRHALEMDGPGASTGRSKCSNVRVESHQSGTSSSEESLQKVPSPIEFLTCFLVKKTRAPKSSSRAPIAEQLKRT
ncbi:uncharacterized protein LOC6558902 [Drosophila grimshawi]|uniref:GH15297 n=1 Tax=Drosophila grimshawi TaxID=7222 RepID=B4IWP7_DROGR|nr:uncharacterized protein LOC6558902 [Drosophila grimshawi]EDV96273.1 GH15297 [Drosophila grimshawi]